MSQVKQFLRRIGKSGVAFLIALALCPVFYFSGPTALLVIDVLLLIPLGVWVSVRAIRYILRHSLWSLRNRLLFVYTLIGILPMFLIILLVGLSSYALMSELAIYLANSELDRRLARISGAANTLAEMPPKDRRFAAQKISEVFGTQGLPAMTIEVNDEAGSFRYPPTAPPLHLRAGWGNVNGLLFKSGQFHAWCHILDKRGEITVVALLPDDTIATLVPNLGDIALLEFGGSESQTDSGYEPSARHHKMNLPPPVNRLDLAFPFIRSRTHFDWNNPGKPHDGILRVQSRPSAVLRVFFSDSEIFRGVLFGFLIGVAVLFILVELIALVIGISLSARITSAVNQIYEGTRRVTHGDFRHRIAVKSKDQLGELGASFNQMTGNLERLLVIEKEKERLQTELEIAREVQSNLYPKEAPPNTGLKLTVRCDPARMVSGDYYDYQVVSKGKMTFAIGDVAGKGISAALLMATLQAALRAQTNDCTDEEGVDPSILVSKLNKQIFAHTAPEKYATFFFALFDEGSRTLTYTNAGHLSPLLIRNGTVVPLDSNGTVVGAFPFSKYNESKLKLEYGDLLVCYTDGISEPENAYGEMFGEDQMIDIIKRHFNEEDSDTVRLVMEAVRNWTGTSELFDDMTLLLARPVQVTG